MPDEIQRKTRAIMFSDIKGYSRLMGADESLALRLLDEHNATVVPIIKANGGSVLKFIGDAVLSSFESAAEAVMGGIEVQRALAARNADKPEGEQIRIRIGIHIGDVVLKDGDVFGDGVNIAARLEPLAEPGGIVISQTVYDMVKARPEIHAGSLGPKELKNIRDPVTVYKVFIDAVGRAAEQPGAAGKGKPGRPRKVSWALGAALVGLTLVLGGVFGPPLFPPSVGAGGSARAQIPTAPPMSAMATKPIEASGNIVFRRTEAKKWEVEVPVAHDEEAKIIAGASKIGLVLVVARSGFYLGATGGILSGLPNDEGGTMDFVTLGKKLQEIKSAYPKENSLIVVCETGVTRGACDLSRMTGAEAATGTAAQPLFSDQWLLEGEFGPGDVGEGSGFSVRFASNGKMPARRLTPESLARLKALYGLD